VPASPFASASSGKRLLPSWDFCLGGIPGGCTSFRRRRYYYIARICCPRVSSITKRYKIKPKSCSGKSENTQWSEWGSPFPKGRERARGCNLRACERKGGKVSSEFSLENEVIKTFLRIVWENSAPTLRPLPDHVTVFQPGQPGIWANPWENSATTLRPLPDHVIVIVCCFNVGEFRTNVAAVTGYRIMYSSSPPITSMN